MANKSSRKEIYLLLFIVTVLLILLVWHKKENINYNLPKLEKISSQETDKIVITNKNIKKVFLRDKSAWKINDFRGNNSKIEDLLKSVCDLKITDMISQSGNYLRYGLDSKDKVSVDIFGNGKKLMAFFAGSTSESYGRTYLMLPNDKKVYQVQGAIKDELIKDVDYWRDKTVLNFNKKDVLSIDINYKDLNFTLVKEKEKWFFKKDKVELEQELVKDLLSFFSSFKCTSFLEDINGAKELNIEEKYIFNFKNSKQELSIFNSINKKNDKLLATSSDEEFPFFISKIKGDELLKIKERILKNNKTGGKK